MKKLLILSIMLVAFHSSMFSYDIVIQGGKSLEESYEGLAELAKQGNVKALEALKNEFNADPSKKDIMFDAVIVHFLQSKGITLAWIEEKLKEIAAPQNLPRVPTPPAPPAPSPSAPSAIPSRADLFRDIKNPTKPLKKPDNHSNTSSSSSSSSHIVTLTDKEKEIAPHLIDFNQIIEKVEDIKSRLSNLDDEKELKEVVGKISNIKNKIEHAEVAVNQKTKRLKSKDVTHQESVQLREDLEALEEKEIPSLKSELKKLQEEKDPLAKQIKANLTHNLETLEAQEESQRKIVESLKSKLKDFDKNEIQQILHKLKISGSRAAKELEAMYRSATFVDPTKNKPGVTGISGTKLTPEQLAKMAQAAASGNANRPSHAHQPTSSLNSLDQQMEKLMQEIEGFGRKGYVKQEDIEKANEYYNNIQNGSYTDDNRLELIKALEKDLKNFNTSDTEYKRVRALKRSSSDLDSIFINYDETLKFL